MVKCPSSVQNQASRLAEVQERQAVLGVRDRRGSRGLAEGRMVRQARVKNNWQNNGGQKQARVRRAEASRSSQRNKAIPTETRKELGNRDKRS